MPVEYRDIRFSPAEVQAAVVHYAQVHNLKLPRAPIETIEILPNEEMGAVVNFGSVEEAGPKIAPLKLNRTELAAAMVAYCQASKRPIPHDAAKAMKKRPHGGLALMERILWKDAWDSEPPPN